MAGPELVATALMLQTGLWSQTSVSLTRIVTGSNFLFGDRGAFGAATTEEMTGGTSTTVPNVGQFELLPDASVAVHVTDVVPNANVEPEGGRQLAVTAGQLSNTVGCRFAAAPLALVQRIVGGAGQEIESTFQWQPGIRQGTLLFSVVARRSGSWPGSS